MPKCNTSINEPNNENSMPTTKHMQKPFIRVDQLSVVYSLS